MELGILPKSRFNQKSPNADKKYLSDDLSGSPREILGAPPTDQNPRKKKRPRKSPRSKTPKTPKTDIEENEIIEQQIKSCQNEPTTEAGPCHPQQANSSYVDKHLLHSNTTDQYNGYQYPFNPYGHHPMMYSDPYFRPPMPQYDYHGMYPSMGYNPAQQSQ
jgi:hypothetical protein